MLKQLADRLSHPGQGHPRRLRIGAIILVMLCAIGGGTLSLAPLVWTDSTTFVSSALATLNTGSLQLHAGRGAGYVALLAGLFAAGGTMTAAVLAQQVLWCASMGLMALVVVRLLPLGYSLLVMALAFYPGLQLFNNLILAESLYASTLAAALSVVVLAATSRQPRHACVLLVIAIVLTALAALLKAQGIPVFAAVGAISLWIAWRQRSRITAAVVVMSLAAASVALAASLGTKSKSQDPTSAVFATKTLFCIHLDLVLASDTTAAFASSTMGSHAPQFMAMLETDLRSKEGEFKTLGFYADKCQYDMAMDQLGITGAGLGAEGLSQWYRQAFVKAVIRHPQAYIAKVVRQMVYGLKMSLPPLGLTPSYGSEPAQLAMVETMLDKAGVRRGAQEGHERVSAPLLAHADKLVGPVLRAASLVASLAMVASLAGLAWRRWRAHPLAAPAAIASLVWFAQIGGVALTHTLDIWRYISPVAPAAVMALALTVCIAIDMGRQRAATTA